MNRVTCMFLLLLSGLLAAGSAWAAPVAFDFSDALRLLGGSVTVPPEWDGIWAAQDSIYNCTGGLLTTSSRTDTLCSGQVYNTSPPGPVTYSCTGTSDATTFHWTCNGSANVFPDCKATYAIQGDGTRSGASYRFVITTNVTYSGTAAGCDIVPGSCTRIVSNGTRTGPSTCLTPAKVATWGRLKLIYR